MFNSICDSQGVAIMFLMKAEFMHELFGIPSDDPEEAENQERKDSSIMQVCKLYYTFTTLYSVNFLKVSISIFLHYT